MIQYQITPIDIINPNVAYQKDVYYTGPKQARIYIISYDNGKVIQDNMKWCNATELLHFITLYYHTI